MKKAIMPLILAIAMAPEALPNTTGKLLKLDPQNIFIPKHGEGFHYRRTSNYGTPEEFNEFKDSIRVNGLVVPIEVKKVTPSAENGNCEYELVAGFRRMKAIHALIKSGVTVATIPAVLSTGTDEDRLARLFANDTTQVQLSFVEQAEIAQRLRVEAKMEPQEISDRIGKSLAQVYNLLKVAEQPKKLKDQIASGKISNNAVLTILRNEKDTDKAIDKIKAAIANTENTTTTSGEAKKATAGDVNVKKPSKMNPFEKLRNVYVMLDKEGVQNEMMAVLEVLITKSKTASVEELAEIVRGKKAPKAAEPAASVTDTTSTDNAPKRKPGPKASTKKTTAQKPPVEPQAPAATTAASKRGTRNATVKNTGTGAKGGKKTGKARGGKAKTTAASK